MTKGELIPKQEKLEILEDPLKYRANYYYLNAIPETKIERDNITTLLLECLKMRIIEGKHISISIHARVREGKSTLGIQFAWWIIHKVMIPLSKTNRKMTVKNIARDQGEFNRITGKNSTLNNTVVVIDEWSKAEDRGENISVEKALRQIIKDIQAYRYLHDIWISPREIDEDETSELIFEIIETNKKKQTISFRIYYNLYRGGHQEKVLIGIANVSVKKLLKEWKKVEHIFYKEKPTKKEMILLNKTRKKDFYTEYYIKKKEKSELLLNENVWDQREMETSTIVKAVTEKLRTLAKLTTVVTKDLISNFVIVELNKRKGKASIVYKIETVSKCYGLLNCYRTEAKLERQLEKLEKKEAETNIRQIEADEVAKGLDEIKQAIIIQENELDRLIKVKEKYDTFESTK